MTCLPALWPFNNPYFDGFFRDGAILYLLAIGSIPAVLLILLLYFKFNKIAAAFTAIFLISILSLIAWWAYDCEYWFTAPWPTDCGKDHCDNDGTIRTMLAIGGFLGTLSFPAMITSLISIPILFRRFKPNLKA